MEGSASSGIKNPSEWPGRKSGCHLLEPERSVCQVGLRRPWSWRRISSAKRIIWRTASGGEASSGCPAVNVYSSARSAPRMRTPGSGATASQVIVPTRHREAFGRGPAAAQLCRLALREPALTRSPPSPEGCRRGAGPMHARLGSCARSVGPSSSGRESVCRLEPRVPPAVASS